LSCPKSGGHSIADDSRRTYPATPLLKPNRLQSSRPTDTLALSQELQLAFLYYYAYILTLKQKYLKAHNIIEKIFLLNNNPNIEVLNLKNKISQYLNKQ
jgi:hypothetical protein